MRIINLKMFLELPAGTLYMKFEPNVFGPLLIKGGSIMEGEDFLYQQLEEIDADDGIIADRMLEDSEKNDASFNLDLDCQGRDGLYHKDQLYAIYERKDVIQLIERLNAALKNYT